MIAPRPLEPEVALNLALAVVESSTAPLLLLDEDLRVIAASASFGSAFQIDPVGAAGYEVFGLGTGEWDVPELRSRLNATVSGEATIEAYEMDLRSERTGTRRLVLDAHKLEYGDLLHVRLLLSVSDVTDIRRRERRNADRLREKAILLQEVRHRIANSLQIIASVLMQDARRVQSAETRIHLRDAHDRVMSVAVLQRQLAASSPGGVEMRSYLLQLCQSIETSMIQDPCQLRLEVMADESMVSADTSVSLGLVATELVINALKHAFPEARAGKIVVSYLSNGFDWTLSVSDNGVGMPAPDQSAAGGLGTSIVQGLSKRLHARTEIADAHPGTTVSVIHCRQEAAAHKPGARLSAHAAANDAARPTVSQ
jgi:two-component sensor histidine kinase